MNCCNNPNVLLSSDDRTLSAFIMFQCGRKADVSQGHPQTCHARRGARGVSCWGFMPRPNRHTPLLPISLDRAQSFDPRPVVRKIGKCSHCVCPGREPEQFAEHKHCLCHKWTIQVNERMSE